MLLHQVFKDRILKQDLKVVIQEEYLRAIMDHSLSLKISKDVLFLSLFLYLKHKITSFKMTGWCLPQQQMIALLVVQIL